MSFSLRSLKTHICRHFNDMRICGICLNRSWLGKSWFFKKERKRKKLVFTLGLNTWVESRPRNISGLIITVLLSHRRIPISIAQCYASLWCIQACKMICTKFILLSIIVLAHQFIVCFFLNIIFPLYQYLSTNSPIRFLAMHGTKCIFWNALNESNLTTKMS